jgi:hypothetical protein
MQIAMLVTVYAKFSDGHAMPPALLLDVLRGALTLQRPDMSVTDRAAMRHHHQQKQQPTHVNCNIYCG